MIREGLSGTAQITREPKWWQPSDSERRIISSRQVEGFPVLVSVTIGDKTFLGQWRERLYFILTLATLLSAVAVLVTAQILRLSARNEAAARLASERRLLAALIDTPAALCAVLDQQGRVIYCNDRFRQLIARDNEPGDILRDEAVHGAAPILAFAAGNDARGIEVDLQVVRPGEATHYLHFSLSHRSLPEIGECTILMGHDETLRHQARQAIAQTAKLVTLGEMTTGMAHELSQPLNVIKMAAQNALSEVAPAEPRPSRAFVRQWTMPSSARSSRASLAASWPRSTAPPRSSPACACSDARPMASLPSSTCARPAAGRSSWSASACAMPASRFARSWASSRSGCAAIRTCWSRRWSTCWSMPAMRSSNRCGPTRRSCSPRPAATTATCSSP